MKNKRGFLLAEETLKLIIALISIGILAFLLFSLYGSSKESREEEFAQETLNHFFESVNAENENVEIYNPSGWHINSWPNQYTTGLIFKKTLTDLPLSCSNLGWDSCVCICKGKNPFSCDDAGACMENTKNLQFGSLIEIKNPPITLQINYETNEVSKA